MKNDRKYGAIIKQAHEAGMIAGEGITPVPMVIGTPTTTFGNDIDYTKPVEIINAGACGFAYVHIAGNTSFGRWALAKTKLAQIGSSARGLFRKSEYHGGLVMPVFEFGQSMERKEAYAREFARVLDYNGVVAHSSSRMD
jgi:hypothetical protein